MEFQDKTLLWNLISKNEQKPKVKTNVNALVTYTQKEQKPEL
jgi:hypothetical protein